MTKKEKKKIFKIIGILVLIIIILFVIKSITKNKENDGETLTKQAYVEIQEDGTNLNTSDKLKQTKKLGELEFSNISLTSKDGQSYITADVKNTSSSNLGNKFIHLTIVDDKNETLSSVTIYLGNIKPEETITINSKASSDFANAYDFLITE